MLKNVSKFLIFFSVLLSCNSLSEQNEKVVDNITKSINTVGKDNYWFLFRSIEDSIYNWDKNDLGNYKFSRTGKKMVIDSNICFNVKKDKLISVLLNFNFKNKIADGFDEFYGAKIKGKWYFWSGGYTPVERRGIKGVDFEPLTYIQLHKFAIGSLGGYLDANGKIRNDWFENQFSGNGWCTFKERYIYKSILDGQKIDNEKDFWNYIWKKKGLGLWITKFSNDSILKKETQIGRKLDTEEKNEIRMYISSKMVLGK